MKFNYYYGSQADQFNFVRIPKVLLTEKTFAALSYPAKMMYGVLLDRMSLSRKNGWFDEQNRVFIIYQIGELQKDFGLSKKKAIDILEELEDFGLLEKKRRGHGLPNILYVKSFMDGVAQAGDSASENPAADARQKKRYSRSASPGTSGMVGVGTSGLTGTAGLFRSDGHAAGKIRSNNEGSSIGKPCVGFSCIGKSNAGRTGTGESCVRSSDRGNSAPAQSSPESMAEAADSEQAAFDTGDSPFGNKDLRCSDGENSAVSKEFTP